MARTGFVALACAVLSASVHGIEVVTPSDGLTVVADRTYTVEWTGAPSGRFEIDLYHCGSMCMDDECGDWVTALCPYGEEGCPDNEGDYDIVMPEPMMGSSGDGYKVRVMEVDSDESDCSDAFTLVASSEAPFTAEQYMLDVTSPATGDMARAGEEYTVEWDYDNGVGSKVDRFDIDLYMAGGDGDCGTYVTSICDKESIGCKDSMGDYDVEIPSDTPSGDYQIRVGRHEDTSLFGCSGTFTVDGSDDMSMSFRF